MKIRTRIAAAVTAAVATVFIGAPAALAHEGHEHSMFDHAGQPVDVVAISIVGVVLLAIVLIGGTLVGNLFEKK